KGGMREAAVALMREDWCACMDSGTFRQFMVGRLDGRESERLHLVLVRAPPGYVSSSRIRYLPPY
ncbi:hypothetical protein KIN20_020579, partial [Parelaphostrongylus tenuis]